jgi:hypothetical protein
MNKDAGIQHHLAHLPPLRHARRSHPRARGMPLRYMNTQSPPQPSGLQELHTNSRTYASPSRTKVRKTPPKKIIILAWKFIIHHFYQSSEQHVAFTDHTSITKATLARFAELALALGFSQKFERRIYYNTCSGANTPNEAINRSVSTPLRATLWLGEGHLPSHDS